MKLLIRAALSAGIVWITFRVVDGLTYDGEWLGIVLVVTLLAVANALVKPILKILALPIRMMTLGLATLAINVLVVFGAIWIAELADQGISSTGWQATVLGALMISVLTAIVASVIRN